MTQARRPTIGITRSRSDPPNPAVFENYARCVRQAGGSVKWLRPSEEEPPEAILGSLNGLLLTGGSDVDPHYYQEEPDPRTKVNLGSILRDELELPLVREALKRDIPVLGICRGMQVLNVALGGTLHQHIEGHQESEDGHSAVHPVTFAAGSRLARMLSIDGAVTVNSLHHQALKAIAPGLEVVATTHDGVVEAVEGTDHRWVFGVQCHPERTDEVPPELQRLFEGLVQAAGGG